ncbi:hypothetical protein Pmani_040097 [Petrolisthes manimaculis]|uniref:Uncharacterized protein n=1 Tax=Petrolisthes manimaculis TaxID=1843537 RepID=A0AAE1NB89_9EUCA|nr:hypothetical protein Pmani_040097 [Petrolisthes manimaculis]
MVDGGKNEGREKENGWRDGEGVKDFACSPCVRFTPKMMRFVLMLVVVGVVACQECKVFCKHEEGPTYYCCDDEYNAYYSQESSSQPPASASQATSLQPESNCYYYCVYDGGAYCCADNTRPIPASHDRHEGSCVEEEDQVCKSSGIYLLTKKAKVSKTSGALQLASQPGKELDSCASDGYCKSDERCCPSKCARKHVCLKALPEEEQQEE